MVEPEKFQEVLTIMGELEQERTAAGGDPETNRNIANSDLFEAIVRESYGDILNFGAGHHFMFMRKGASIPLEVPSADAMIFNHDIAQKIWGTKYKDILTRLALEPVKTRDALLRELYHGR